MGQLVIVNAPSSFAFIWSVIKPWLSKETADKVEILSSDYKEALLEIVDHDSLPSFLGGDCNCEEAGGCHLSGAGPWLDGRVGWGPKSMAKEQVKALEETQEVRRWLLKEMTTSTRPK
ncbi:CRAL-TRIO domain-containing protein [Mycena floridula]|nr:CRAL-TRIO domain-containing protein [Mycena floridula]